jgi:Na+-driven multidrug efflux pump
MMLSIFFYTRYTLVGTYWVSVLSSEAIAAVSISQISLFMMISLGFGITAGSGVTIAIHIGAKDKSGAERVLGQSFFLSAIMALFFTGIALIFTDSFLTISGASGSIFEPAKEYFTIGLAILTYITSLRFQELGAIAFSLGFRIEFFAYLPAAGFGFSFGAMAMMRQNMGAKNYERTKEAFRKSVFYAFIGAAGLRIITTLFASPLILVFTPTRISLNMPTHIW